MKKTIKETVNLYVKAWNLTDTGEITAAFEKCLSANCTYTDKNTAVIKGLQNIVSLVLSSHKIHPGRFFSLTSELDYFGNQCRYYWHVSFVGKEGKDAMDYVEYDDDNKLTRIVGFL